MFFSLEVPTFLILWRHEDAAIVSISVTNASNTLLTRGPEWRLSFVFSRVLIFPETKFKAVLSGPLPSSSWQEHVLTNHATFYSWTDHVLL